MHRWEVVGGAETGGIIVRKGADVKSEAEKERLSTGALVQEVSLQWPRLNFRRLSGTGPATGWVTVKLQAKELLVRTDKLPPNTGEGPAWTRRPPTEKFDPYTLLGVAPDATDAVIKSAYRKGSLAVHPDRNPDDADAASKFRELTRAKDFLLNPFKRRLYNLRHGFLKPTVGLIWWSDWDTIFEEIIIEDAELESEPSTIPATVSPSDDGLVDILVFGATGITGTLACSLLHRGLFAGRSWAIAGRDGRKLGLLRSKFGSAPGFRGSTRIETPADIQSVVRGARVVVDLTGPSREIGLGVAEACIQAGRHYVDNTGEVDFSKMVKDKLDSPARAAGSCLVLHSGYCSVPVDFAVWRMVRYLREQHSLPTRRVDAYDSTSGMVLSGTNYVSGGIWGGEMTKNISGMDPFLLGGLRRCGVRPEEEERDEPFCDSNTGGHGILAAVSDRLVVRSSCGLFDDSEPYGEQFSFRNWATFPTREAAMHGMMMSRVAQKMHASLVKQKKIPPTGSGPSERVRQECLTSRVFVAEADEPGPSPRKAYCVMHAGPGGFGDRYEGTATMSLELACTLLDAEDGGQKGALRPGWGTPTFHTAHLGFFDRLVARGARFRDIVDGPPPHELFQNLLGAAMALESGSSEG